MASRTSGIHSGRSIAAKDIWYVAYFDDYLIVVASCMRAASSYHHSNQQKQ
jgi:hypothetical protein